MEKLLHERLRNYTKQCFSINRIQEIEGTIHLGDLLDKWVDAIERYYIPRPRFEDGEPVKYKSETEYGTVIGFVTYLGGSDYESVGLLTKENDIVNIPQNELLKRPAPKVIDADGVPCKPNDEVWSTSKEGIYEEGDMMIVVGIDAGVKERQVLVRRALGGAGEHWVNSEYLTHERPVFDAEGVRIRKGDTVYDVAGINQEPMRVLSFGDALVCVVLKSGIEKNYKFNELTHREPDSLEKLRDDISRYSVVSPHSTAEIFEWRDRLTALMERDA